MPLRARKPCITQGKLLLFGNVQNYATATGDIPRHCRLCQTGNAWAGVISEIWPAQNYHLPHMQGGWSEAQGWEGQGSARRHAATVCMVRQYLHSRAEASCKEVLLYCLLRQSQMYARAKQGDWANLPTENIRRKAHGRAANQGIPEAAGEARAPRNDGADHWQETAFQGNSPPYQRQQGGQPPGEFDAARRASGARQDTRLWTQQKEEGRLQCL